MAKQLLDQYIDRSSIKSDTEFFIGEAEKVFAAIGKLRASGLSAESVKSFKGIADGLKDVEKAQNDLNKTLITGERASREQIKTTTELAKQKTAEAKATEAQNKAAQAAAKIDGENIKNKKLLAQYEQQLAKEKEKLAKSQEKANKELEKANNAYQQLNKQYQAAANNSKRRGAELLNEANGNSKLYQQLIATDKEYQENTKDALKYYQQLDLLENSVGQAQRRVGQYERAQFSLNQVLREAPAFVNSVQTGFMAISNNLPILVDEFKRLKESTGSSFSALKVFLGGLFSFQTAMMIGITLVTAYGKEIGQFFGQIFKGKDQINQLAETQKTLNKAFEDSSLKDAVKNVSELTENVRLAKEGLIDKDRVVNQYNETMGKTTGKVKSLDEVEQQLVKNGPAYIQMMLFKAAANLALEDASKKALEAELNRQKKNEEFSSALDNAGSGLGSVPDAPGDLEAEIDKRAALKRAKRKKKAIDDAQSEADTYKAIAENFMKQAAEISKNFKFDFFQGDFMGDNPKKDKKLEDFKKWLADFYLEYQQAIKELLAIGEQFDKMITEQNQKRIDDALKTMGDALKKGSDQIELQRNKELLSLEEYYATGQMSEEKYKQRKLEINDVYDTKLLEQEVDYYEKLIAFLKQEGMDVTDAEAKLYATRLKMQEAFNKKRDELLDEQNKSDRDKAKEHGKEIEKAGQETLKTFKQLREQLINELRSSMAALVSGYFERQKNQLQDQIDKNEELKKAEIDRINASSDTEEKKAARIAIVNAKADAQKVQLEQRQRRADEQKARFERMFALAQIGQNTAMEATKYSGNPLKVAMIIAIGVAQAARVLATPIPKYRFGTEYHKGGPAIVGDGGVPEVVTIPDNTSYTTPDKPTLTYLPKGAKVTPSVDEYLAKMPVPLPYIMQMKSGSSNNTETMMKKGFASVVNAINSKRETHISGTHSGVAAVIKNGNAWLKYVNDQTNF